MFQSHEFWCQRHFQMFSEDEVGGKIIQGVESESESENLLHLESELESKSFYLPGVRVGNYFTDSITLYRR